MSKALFITGTGTDIGKTYVTGLIVKKLAEEGKSAAYYKAAMSGNDHRADGSLIPGDALFVQKMSISSLPSAAEVSLIPQRRSDMVLQMKETCGISLILNGNRLHVCRSV